MRKSETDTATGSRTHGRPDLDAVEAAAIIDGSQLSDRVPTLTRRASM